MRAEAFLNRNGGEEISLRLRGDSGHAKAVVRSEGHTESHGSVVDADRALIHQNHGLAFFTNHARSLKQRSIPEGAGILGRARENEVLVAEVGAGVNDTNANALAGEEGVRVGNLVLVVLPDEILEFVERREVEPLAVETNRAALCRRTEPSLAGHHVDIGLGAALTLDIELVALQTGTGLLGGEVGSFGDRSWRWWTRADQSRNRVVGAVDIPSRATAGRVDGADRLAARRIATAAIGVSHEASTELEKVVHIVKRREGEIRRVCRVVKARVVDEARTRGRTVGVGEVVWSVVALHVGQGRTRDIPTSVGWSLRVVVAILKARAEANQLAARVVNAAFEVRRPARGSLFARWGCRISALRRLGDSRNGDELDAIQVVEQACHVEEFRIIDAANFDEACKVRLRVTAAGCRAIFHGREFVRAQREPLAGARMVLREDRRELRERIHAANFITEIAQAHHVGRVDACGANTHLVTKLHQHGAEDVLTLGGTFRSLNWSLARIVEHGTRDAARLATREQSVRFRG